jgi:type 1 glutamine amidotransferase
MYRVLAAGLAAAGILAAQVTPEERSKVEAALPAKAPAKPKKPRRLLVVNRDMRDGKPVKIHHESVPLGNLALELLGSKTGAWKITLDGDPEAWRGDRLKEYDAVCFMNTTGVLTEDKELRWSLLKFIRDGGGFAAFHAGGPATFVQYPKYDQFPEFGVMVGGYENGGHPWKHTETYYVRAEDPKHPAARMFGAASFPVKDEVFQMMAPYSREAVRVLLSIDASKSDVKPERRILAERQADLDFPVSWIKRYGQGRVFYTFLGHNKETYWNSRFLDHFLAGIQYALGDLAADDTPSRFVRAKK